MATRYIYLSEELNQKLKEEGNVSALISQLLEEHYKNTKFEGLTKEQIQRYKKIAIEKNKCEKELNEILNGRHK